MPPVLNGFRSGSLFSPAISNWQTAFHELLEQRPSAVGLEGSLDISYLVDDVVPFLFYRICQWMSVKCVKGNSFSCFGSSYKGLQG